MNTQMIWRYENNINKKLKILILLHDVIPDMFSNEKLISIVTELFIRKRKLDISPVFITQSYFDTLFCYESSKKGNFNKFHFIIHQILTFKTLWIFKKMYCISIFSFGYWHYSCIRYFFTFQKESFRKNIKTIDWS